MADMRRFLDFTGLGIYDEKIKAVISSGDAQALADAKKYFEDNKGLFEAAGTVATAREALEKAIAAVEAKVDAITDGESIDSFADVETALAGKQAVGDYATKAEAQSYADAKDEAIAAAKKAGDDAQADIDAYMASNDEAVADLEAYVGTIPEGATSTNVVAYVQEKTAGIATSENLEALTNRVAQAETDIDNIEKDYLKVTDKTELEGKIGTAQAAAEGAQSYAEGVAGDLADAVEALEGADEAQVARIAALEGTITGLSGAMHFEGVVETDPTKITEGYEQGDVVIYGNKEYVWNNGAFVEFGDASVNAEAITALTGRVDTLAGDMTQAKTDIDNVEAAVATKVEQSAYDEKIAALEGADSGLSGRIATLEGKFGGAEGSVEDMIADAKAEAIATADTNAANKDAVVLAEAQKYAADEDAKVIARVDALESASATHALKSEVEAIAGRVTTVEGKVTTLEGEMDAVEAAVATKAESADLTALADKVTTAEGKISTLEGEMDAVEGRLDDAEEAIEAKAAQADLDTLTTRVDTAETNIAANTAALAKFTEITEAEINSLFA